MPGTYRIYHIIRSLQDHLNSQDVPVFVAPYAAAAQLVEFEREGYVSGIMGSATNLIFGADAVILDIDWDDTKKFWHTDLTKCAEEMGITESQFSDLCLISGYSILPTMPELEVDSNIPRLEAAKHMLQRANNDVYAVCAQAKDENYQMAFHKAKYAVKHAVSMKVNSLEVIQDDLDSVPADTHEFIGQRLPNELYFYLIRGLAGPRVLNWRTRMEILETPPLDGGLSQLYRDLVNNKLVPLRSQSLVMITHLLHRYYQKNDPNLICWFGEGNGKTLNIAEALESAKTADSWHVTAKALPSPPDASSGPLRSAISGLLNESEAKKTVTPRPEGAPAPLTTIPELRPNAVWRFLEHRGYINENHTLSAWGRSLDVALQKAADNGSFRTPSLAKEIEEAIFMAYELIRLDVLNTRNMFQTPPYSGQPMRGSDADKQFVLLISRIACLGSFQHNSIGYTGPLSRALLAYHQVTAAVRGALRDLVEMHACNMFLAGSVKRQIGPPKMFTDLSFELPFVNEPNAGLALLVKSYLDELSNENGRKRSNIREWFVHAQDIDGDLKKVWRLFDAVSTYVPCLRCSVNGGLTVSLQINEGIQAADSAIISSDTRKMFKSASEWLQEKRQMDTNGIH